MAWFAVLLGGGEGGRRVLSFLGGPPSTPVRQILMGHLDRLMRRRVPAELALGPGQRATGDVEMTPRGTCWMGIEPH